MEPIAISWLIASASSPLVAVLALWTVYVFHTYRRRWRTVDLFLLAVASQELITAIFTFSFAILSLINPPLEAPCTFIQWGLISTRTFQVATLASMVVDRALTVRWPYKYRFSVRRNQIRYHIAVLAMIAIMVGVAAVFARVVPPVSGKRLYPGGAICSSHPKFWDLRFMVFLLSLYGMLVVVSFVCSIQVEVHRCRSGGHHVESPFQLPECASPESTVAATASPLDSESSTGSTRALHRPNRQSSRRPYGRRSSGTSDFRWPPVAAVSFLCFAVNHLPYIVLTSLATAMAWLWSPWHEAIIAWLRLAEGVIVPLILCITDQTIRNALKRTFQRRSGALSPLVGDDGPFQMYFDKDHFHKRGTFGSVTPIGIITNYRRTPGKRRNSRKSSGRYMLPGLYSGDSILEKPSSGLSGGGFLKTEPLSKLSCADLTSLGMWREEDDDDEGNYYPTLSDDFSGFSCEDDSALSEDIRISEELYGGSFTTIANDDFEFHDTRPCGGEVRMRPSADYANTNSNVSKPTGDKDTKGDGIKEDIPSNTASDKLRELFVVSLQPEEEEDIKEAIDFSTEDSGQKKLHQIKDVPLLRTVPASTTPAHGLLGPRKATSYSMNDLDLIDNGDSGSEEAVFVLPVKSESTMSLYRLHVDRGLHEILSPAKSETNLTTGDSGFGSGVQANMPWAAVNGRTPDNHWDLRKPCSSPTNKHYPCVLHPRMKRIPWISAWRKLDACSQERNDFNSEKPTTRTQGDPVEVKRASECSEELKANDSISHASTDGGHTNFGNHEQQKEGHRKRVKGGSHHRDLSERTEKSNSNHKNFKTDMLFKAHNLQSTGESRDSINHPLHEKKVRQKQTTNDQQIRRDPTSETQLKAGLSHKNAEDGSEKLQNNREESKKENGETRGHANEENEVFSFESFLKPNPPCFMPQVPKRTNHTKVNCRQKKIAITGFL